MSAEFIVNGTFLAAWLFVPSLVVVYRLISVQERWQEVIDTFVGRAAAAQPSMIVEPTSRPAWHYIKIVRPFDLPSAGHQVPAAELLEPLEEQFRAHHGVWSYALPLAAVMFFVGVDLYLCRTWVLQHLSAVSDLFGVAYSAGNSGLSALAPPKSPSLDIVAALLGAYVWSIYELLTRCATRDLTPAELYGVAFRLLVAVPIGWMVARLAGSTINPAIVFAATAFPVRDVGRLMRQQVLRGLTKTADQRSDRRTRGYLGQTLTGFSHEIIVRLEELRISTVLDMAYADPVCLMFKTGAPIRLVLSWIDESLLAVYAGPLTESLAAAGIPCSLDVLDLWKNWERGRGKENQDLEASMASLARALKTEQPLVADLLRRVSEDTQVRFLYSVWVPGEPSQAD